MGAAVVLRRYPGMSHTIGREEIEEGRKIIVPENAKLIGHR